MSGQSSVLLFGQDLRQNKSSWSPLRKVFDKDISPTTVSSWITQTVILCYELSGQEAHIRLKPMMSRPFAASKAFQSGVSLEQILTA